MDNDINFITGIKDPYLKRDHPFLTTEVGTKIVHLIQSYPMKCPYCGQLMKCNGFRKSCVTVKVLPTAGDPTVLKIRKQQYICPSTKKCPQIVTRVAKIAGIGNGCRIANNVKYHIAQELSRSISMKDIAQQHGVSTNTVERQLSLLEDNLTPDCHWLPSTIAFDDFKSGKFAKSNMSMILMNPQNHRTIDIIQSRNSRFMKSYFLTHFTRKVRWSVRIVVVDQPYRNLIHELFPKGYYCR